MRRDESVAAACIAEIRHKTGHFGTPAAAFVTALTAHATPSWVRPLTTTAAPEAASPLAAARPMPAVDALTMAVLPERLICMGIP